MNDGLISKRYAKALLEYAAACGEDAALYARMKTLLSVAIAVPRVRQSVQNPMVAAADKRQLLFEAMGDGKIENSAAKFADLLLANQREGLMVGVAVCYTALYRRRNHISTVMLTAATPLPAEVIERVRKSAEAQTQGTVDITVHTNPAIDGGIIFQINDRRLDASVAGQLAKVKRQFVKNNKIIV